MEAYLLESSLLNYSHPVVQDLLAERGWKTIRQVKAIEQIYNFVRDELAFGYNSDDALQSSTILSYGYGQCNTKGIVFMALLRAVGMRCRLHGFTISKELQKGRADWPSIPALAI